MNKATKWLSLLLGISLLLNGTLLYRFLIAGETHPGQDRRITLVLEEGERDVVLTEMRQFLIAVRDITEAANEDNMEKLAGHARAVGTTAAAAVPASLMGKLPIKFKQLGLETHNGFDAIAMDAESLGDAPHAMEQLANLLDNCIACHSTFQIRTAPVMASLPSGQTDLALSQITARNLPKR